jgi:hypothetical protein
MPHKRSKTKSQIVSLQEDVFRALWKDKKYLRLHAFKDEALKAWNRADAHHDLDLPKHQRRVKRALRRLQDYEDRAIAIAKAKVNS